ncbi:MAG: hypothetical protein HRT36_07255 [Alphaproteobacteria bacterium]|nr:hypothetical protein [Alphaproteobacteria bacterium]
MTFRLIGAVVFGFIGWLLGTGTVIAGSVFGAVDSAISGAGVFIVLGLLLGLFAGPDIKYLYNQFNK